MALAAGCALLVLGCSSNSAPAVADVAKAIVAGSMAQQEATATSGADYTVYSNYTVTGSGGTLTVTASNTSGSGSAVVSFTETPSSTYPWILTGTITFTNWYDTISGYTVSGTLSIKDTFNSPITYSISLTGSLSLKGGTIDTLSYNIVEATTNGVASPPTGTVTANGSQFNVSQL